jgi:hypothetical protein
MDPTMSEVAEGIVEDLQAAPGQFSGIYEDLQEE